MISSFLQRTASTVLRPLKAAVQSIRGPVSAPLGPPPITTYSRIPVLPNVMAASTSAPLSITTHPSTRRWVEQGPTPAVDRAFVMIDGEYINVGDLLAMMRGEMVLPRLSVADLQVMKYLGSHVEAVGNLSFQGEITSMLLRNMPRSMKESLMRHAKARRIYKIIKQYTNRHGTTNIPQASQILDVISGGRIYFSDLAQFLARIVPRTPEGADQAVAAMEEVGGPERPVQHVNERTIVRAHASRLFHCGDEGSRYNLVYELLGFQSAGAYAQLPMALLERALSGVAIDYNDAATVAAEGAIQVTSKSSLALGYFGVSAFVLGMAAVVLSIPGPLTFGIWSGVPVETIYPYLYSSLAVMLTGAAVYLFNPLGFRDMLRPPELDVGSVNRRFAELQSRVETLKETTSGKIRVEIARNLVRESFVGPLPSQGVDQINQLTAFLARLSNQELDEDFDHFARNHEAGNGVASLDDAVALMEAYQRYSRTGVDDDLVREPRVGSAEGEQPSRRPVYQTAAQ